MGNLDIWEKVKKVPVEATKPITGGRLSGMTEINPMWRFKTLTEQFGLCGVGWKYVITKQWLENGAKEEVSAFINIDLFIKVEGIWSDPIPGTGGSSFTANEKGGLRNSDECFKMALTDAISVSCKSLGIGADIYWEKDTSKYDTPKADPEPPRETVFNSTKISEPTAKELGNLIRLKGISLKKTLEQYKIADLKELTTDQANVMREELNKLETPRILNELEVLDLEKLIENSTVTLGEVLKVYKVKDLRELKNNQYESIRKRLLDKQRVG